MIHSSATSETMSHAAETTTSKQQDAGNRKTEKRPGSPLVDPRNSKSQATINTTTVQVKDENLPYMRELRKYHVNLKKAERQITYLRDCTYTKTIPKQLIPKIQPQTPTKPISLQLKWQRVIINTGHQFTETLIDYWNNHLDQIQKDIETLNAELEKNLDKEEIELINKICLEAQDRYLENIEKNARKKEKKQEVRAASNRT